MEEIQDHCYLPEKWSSNKDHSKAERVIVWEVAKVPRVTSKQLNAFLISLMDGWNQNRIYWFKWEAIMFGEKNTLHSSLRILSHLWNMVVVVSWLALFAASGQDGLPSLMEQWILNYTANSNGKRQDICLRTVSWERGSCSKTTTPSTQVILPKNG